MKISKEDLYIPNAMKEFMREEEMQKYFNVSSTTLREWRLNGLKSVKIGGIRLYKDTYTREFLDNFEVCEYTR